MDDELQEVRDNFYVGNYQKCLQMCETTNASNDVAQSELLATLARCYLSLSLSDKLRQMPGSECPGHKATVFMAILMRGKEASKPAAKEKLLALAKETQDMSCAMLAAIALAMDGSWTEAVQMTKVHPTQEMQALCVFFYLGCNQVAQAEKKLQEMAGNNDDSAAFRLATAALKQATGDPEEAYLTYCDLSTQFPCAEGDDSGSVLLLTGKALANMQRKMFTEAVEDLTRALQTQPKNADILVNLCCCMTHLGKRDEFQKYYALLEQEAPAHPYVVKTQSIRNVFIRFKSSLDAA